MPGNAPGRNERMIANKMKAKKAKPKAKGKPRKKRAPKSDGMKYY